VALKLLGAAPFEVAGPQLPISGAFSEQMVNDIQDMAADYEGGMFAVCADYHAAVNRG
jgi:hypothetical protein